MGESNSCFNFQYTSIDSTRKTKPLLYNHSTRVFGYSTKSYKNLISSLFRSKFISLYFTHLGFLLFKTSTNITASAISLSALQLGKKAKSHSRLTFGVGCKTQSTHTKRVLIYVWFSFFTAAKDCRRSTN